VPKEVDMADPRSVVIIGASLAGAKAAETLRAEGYRGRLVLIGDEPVRPYERPPLSKAYLRGEAGPEAIYVHSQDYYDDNDIELRLSTRVVALDLQAQEIELGSGERLSYDAAVLAVGAEPRHLTIPGAGLEGVHYLRTVGDSDRLREAIRSATRVAVIGAGWIGCEVAASARQMGAEVAVIEVADVPLERVLGPELGRFYGEVHAEHGVEMHLGVGVDSLRGSPNVESVHLTNGTEIAADVVVVGVGVTPRVQLAESAGLAVENGVTTDEFLASSAPGVYAAGDIANAWHPVLSRRIRLEHWSAALNQGPAAARNVLGQTAPYTRIPYFYSDQYDIGMEYSGYATAWDQVLFRGDPASREFIAFWLKDGRVEAGMNVNVWGVTDTIASLVALRRPVDAGLLVDPEVTLEGVLAAASSRTEAGG
jgi:3-phenylpropionate/trans-cinnamate dioxygenase ferredoxin reductase subunit